MPVESYGDARAEGRGQPVERRRRHAVAMALLDARDDAP
jgi:hypothetical protein